MDKWGQLWGKILEGEESGQEWGGGVLPGELGRESAKTGMDMSWGADCAGPSYPCLLRPSDPGPPGACILLHIENQSTSLPRQARVRRALSSEYSSFRKFFVYL